MMRILLSVFLIILIAGSFVALLPRVNARFLIPLYALIIVFLLIRSWWRRRGA
ncbi:hypothetical protein QQ056_14560 [Oscillatoria laete-virens NRMC-F 0139]|nr:hypothetical protein [Oscillatoria laete-virens]MDL5054759.1 hypothetical protein [Oscillatoria laete-virens NRMC-F 0139]